MGLLKPIGKGQGYLKAAFLGFQGSGKTVTAMKLALGTRKHFNLKGPIAMYDTEKGSDYIEEWVRKETGQDLLGVKSRSFSDLLTFTDECLSAGVSVALADSITHPWRELCDAYLSDLNRKREQRCRTENKTFYPMLKVEFQHWQVIKGRDYWQKWVDLYLNAPLHFIICGRAGFEYEYQEPENGGKKELIKSGVKMRVENEFGFEPSLIVEMERDQEQDKNGAWHIKRKATVLKDRFQKNSLDGKVFWNPDYESFRPHVENLTAGVMEPVDTKIKTVTEADEEGNTGWHAERRTREILSQEIKGELDVAYPTKTAKDTKAWFEMLNVVLGTRSWTAVENMPSEKLRTGLAEIRKRLQPELSLEDEARARELAEAAANA